MSVSDDTGSVYEKPEVTPRERQFNNGETEVLFILNTSMLKSNTENCLLWREAETAGKITTVGGK
jgi:hypothetical protein